MKNWKNIRSLFFLTITFAIIISCISCEDDDDDDTGCTEPFNYISLTIAEDTIQVLGTVKVKAQATGCGLTYEWVTTPGEIIGSGAEVIFNAKPCTIGENEIFCIVRDNKNQQESKSVFVTVI